MTARSPGRCPQCGSDNTGPTGTSGWNEPRRRVLWIVQRCNECLVVWLEVPAT